MKQELEVFQRETLAAMEHAQRLVNSLTPEDVCRRPAPEEWSVGECLDHLTITARAYHPMVDDALARATRLGARNYQPAWIWRKFLKMMEPPVKRKYKAVPAFVPQKQRPAQQVLADFLEAHQRLIDALPNLDPLDLGKIRIVSPFAQWMRYPLGLVFYIVPAHCRRHLWQADGVASSLSTASLDKSTT